MNRRQILRGGAAGLAAVAATALSGCTWWPFTRAAKQQEETVVKANAPDSRAITPTAAGGMLSLAVIYYVRLGVPPGAALEVVVTDRTGRKVAESTTRTGQGLPYRVQVAVPSSAQMPIDVTVTLRSPAGHVLSGKKSFASVPGGSTEFLIA